jgi:ankyrin repeat protein
MKQLTAFSLRLLAAALVPALAVTAMPGTANAQFRDGYNFLKALRDRDWAEAGKLLREDLAKVINTRDVTTGETGLSIVVQDRNLEWTRLLLARGANPALADRNGVTPLMHAVLKGWPEGADVLLKRGAQVDQTNGRGETALITAVHQRNPAIVRLLIAAGANPNRADHIAGMTARDYARRDDRTGTLLALLDAKPDKPRPMGPVLGPN